MALRPFEVAPFRACGARVMDGRGGGRDLLYEPLGVVWKIWLEPTHTPFFDLYYRSSKDYKWQTSWSKDPYYGTLVRCNKF